QLLAESLLLALMGGVSGLLLAWAGVNFFLNLFATNFPGAEINVTEMSVVDWRVLAFTLGASLVTGVLCGIVPAIQLSRQDPAVILQQTGARSGIGAVQHRTRSLLVVTELALALVLLIGATLMVRTMVALRYVDTGFDPNEIVVMQTSLNSSRYMSNQAFAN